MVPDAAKREAYVNLEEEVHTETLGLAADAQKTLGYVSRALLLVAEALADASETHREREAVVPPPPPPLPPAPSACRRAAFACVQHITW